MSVEIDTDKQTIIPIHYRGKLLGRGRGEEGGRGGFLSQPSFYWKKIMYVCSNTGNSVHRTTAC